MSDRPVKPIQSTPNAEGKWHAPTSPGIWHPKVISDKQPVSVPTLPKDKSLTPQAEGGWHLPRPQDTIYTTQDTTLITPERMEAIASRPEDIVLSFAPPEEETEPAAPVEPEPLKPGIEETEAETKPSEPAEEGVLDEASLLELERTASDIPAVEEDQAETEADDDEAFSMSELIALSSLVEQTPKSEIVPKAGSGETSPQAVNVSDLSPAERIALQASGQQIATEGSEALSQSGADDPAAYARRQLESLGVSSGTSAAPAASAAPAQPTEDPAAYARRQLEQLGLGGSQPAAQPSISSLPPQQQELALKFRDTENQVRTLRTAFQRGQLTRDQLQEQLKRLIILDENNVWWMMGLETDNWYRFDSSSETWVLAQPPYTGGQSQPPPAASTFEPANQSVGPLSYYNSQPVASQPGDQTQVTFGTPVNTGGFGITEELNLPRRDVPVEDPERTFVGQGGANLSSVQGWAASTLPNATPVTSETMASQGFGFDQPVTEAAVPSPVEQFNTAPDYSLQAAASTSTFDEIAQKQQRQTIRTLVTVGVLAVVAVILIFACGIGYVVVQYNSIAGDYQTQITALANYHPEFQTARILDMNGNMIAELNSQDGGSRTTVPLGKISPFMIHALISLENERYYEDPGWDWIAIGRAFLQNLSAGQVESGASTITQQIAEQLILHQPTNTPDLKLREIIISSQIAQQYDKNFILQLYLNEVYFGNQAYGVEAASQFYFGHSAENLNLPEAAMLAGMISSPVQYNPVRTSNDTLTTYNERRKLTFDRMDYVIQRMQQVGCLQFQHAPYINQPFCVDTNIVKQATVQKATVVAATYDPREVQFKYPHFVQFVQAAIERNFGAGEMFRNGFVIKTTLNPDIQNVAESNLRQTMQNLILTGVNTGSVMVTDPRTGAIRAMVGSPDFNNNDIDGQVNGALTWQQPGSSIKPVVYTAALEGVDQNGDGRPEYMTPATILWDVPTTFENNYQPFNFDRVFHGPVALRYALQNSYNIPAIKAYQFIGNEKFKDTAGRMGLHFLDGATFGLPTGIGATEVSLYDMMGAYGTLANGGMRAQLYSIESITDASGNPIQIPDRPAPVLAVQPQIAYLMDSILSDDTARAAAFGVNGTLTIPGLPTSGVVAAKTGTTNDARDLWTMGFTQNMVVGVWLGRPDNNPTAVIDGGYGSAAPLWRNVMTAALQTVTKPGVFAPPPGVIQQQICADTGSLPANGCTNLRTELFVQSEPPPSADQALVQQVTIDSWTGLRANSFCPDNNVNITVLNITDTAAVAWLNSPAGTQIAQRLGITAATQATAPTTACDTNTEVPIARIVFPANGDAVSSIVAVTGAASGASFNRYQLEVAPASAPGTFTIIGNANTVPQTTGLLGQWNTTTVANGQYILRLAMFSNSGGYLYRTATVTVSNTAPTPPPIPTPTSPPFANPPDFGATATPIPFDQIAPPGG